MNAAAVRGARRRGIGRRRGAKARAVRTTLTISSMISRLRTGSTPILGLGGSIAIVRFEEVAHGTERREKNSSSSTHMTRKFTNNSFRFCY